MEASWNLLVGADLYKTSIEEASIKSPFEVTFSVFCICFKNIVRFFLHKSEHEEEDLCLKVQKKANGTKRTLNLVDHKCWYKIHQFLARN